MTARRVKSALPSLQTRCRRKRSLARIGIRRRKRVRCAYVSALLGYIINEPSLWALHPPTRLRALFGRLDNRKTGPLAMSAAPFGRYPTSAECTTCGMRYVVSGRAGGNLKAELTLPRV
ncbi:hypothetical protein MTO96_020106 [Rhipicephalus appendiculatus]